MIWLAALLAFNALVFVALYFKPLPARSAKPTFIINEDNIDQTWGR